MSDTLLRLVEVQRRVGMKKTAIYGAIAAGTFPSPVKFGVSSFWIETEVQAWIDKLKVARNGDGIGDSQRAA